VIVPDAPEQGALRMIRSVACFGISFREWALLLALSLLRGSAFFFGQVALVELPPFTIVFCRVALATLVLVSIAMATGQRHIFPGAIGSSS
jgi:hypothetical protein